MQRPLTAGPSKSDADALVALPKYIKRMPPVRERTGSRRIKTRSVYDSSGRPTGLMVDAHVSMPRQRGRHGEVPQVSLVWRNVSIRCIDWEVRHTFADGTVVVGWHEHLWDDTHRREAGRRFDPPLGSSATLEQLFVCACQHWNITILTRQDQHLREVDKGNEH